MERRGRENMEADVGDIRNQNSVSEVAMWGCTESKLEDTRPWAAVRVSSPFSRVTVCLQSTSAVTHFLGTEQGQWLGFGAGMWNHFRTDGSGVCKERRLSCFVEVSEVEETNISGSGQRNGYVI